jgi:hypothetical protein
VFVAARTSQRVKGGVFGSVFSELKRACAAQRFTHGGDARRVGVGVGVIGTSAVGVARRAAQRGEHVVVV